MKTLANVLLLSATTLLAGSACASRPAGGTTTTTLPSTGGGQVVISSPVRANVQHTIVGRVTGIDRNDGDVTVETPDGSKMTLRLPPVALATVREDDRVLLNVSISPR